MVRKSTSSVKPFYITTTLPYVNAPLHLGHATEIIRADAVARYRRLIGCDVFFNTGTDEHGMKIFEAAQKAGEDVQKFVDEYATLYKETLQEFGVTEDAHYIRTTDPRHIAAAQEFWRQCDANGYVYKKNYRAKYCVGCEEEKTDSELINGKCPTHDRAPETINEENYFFKLSALREKLLALYDARPDLLVPAYRLNELREFIRRGLKDFSISRLKTKLPWGVPVPGDENQVMYVWFDALINYISTLGWPDESGDFKKFWVEGTPTQYCGKDNTRFQGLMWQAMLMAAGLPPTQTIVVDGFILGEGGEKMSKTLGNVVDPLEIVREYGTDALRYFVLREFHPFEDTSVSSEKLKEWYNANLANGIGNLVSRIMKMAVSNDVRLERYTRVKPDEFDKKMETFDLKSATDLIWLNVLYLDGYIQNEEPFKKIKSDPDKARKDIQFLLNDLRSLGEILSPFLPDTSRRILECVDNRKMPETPLFPRKE